jgi:site-specific DNA-methyltransferase (adenine-specific)
VATPNALFYGDNLEILRTRIDNESVDLIYLDPPFSSNRSYNVLFKSKSGAEAQAQIEAFDDTWTWSQQAEDQYLGLIQGGAPTKVADAIEAMRRLLGDNDVLAYLVMMTARLQELHRVLKPTGSLFLHCDPTASHYLKAVLDAIFGPVNFRNEIIWQRVAAKGGQMGRLPANHDVILSYAKSSSATWNEIRLQYDPDALDAKTLAKYSMIDENGRRYRLGPLLHPEQGRRPNLEYELMGVRRTWRWSKERMDRAVAAGRIVQTAPGRVPQQKMYLDEQPGRLVGDVWTDVNVLNSQAAERLGYPTQKPLALLERIIAAASDPGDIVLDPFCGCGTTIDAAQKLGRRWIGIDITFLAIDLIENRLRGVYGDGIKASYVVHGIPHDRAGAEALMRDNPFDFERWAVALVDGEPHERHKQVADKGIDGVIRFPLDHEYRKVGKSLVSVKGGAQVNPGMVRDLVGTVDQQKAEMGVFISMREPTAGMQEVAQRSGIYEWPITGRRYPRIQILTVDDLLAGKRADMPTPFIPYQQAKRLVDDNQLALDLG